MDNRLKILIVEDEPEIAKSTISFLSENDFIVLIVLTLKSAIKRLRITLCYSFRFRIT